MYIVYLSHEENKRLNRIILQNQGRDRTELQKVLQAFYDEMVDKHIGTKHNRQRYIDKVQQDGQHAKLRVRLNGRQSKRIFVDEGLPVELKPRRLRCDDESWCRTIFLSVLLPRLRPILSVAAEMLLAGSSAAFIARYRNTEYTPRIVRGLWKNGLIHEL